MQPGFRRTIITHTRLTGLGENMLEPEQSVRLRGKTITAFWDVFPKDHGREAGMSYVREDTGVSTFALQEEVQVREDLVSAFMKDRHAAWLRWFESEIEARYEASGGGLEIIADVLQAGFEDSKCLGCAFLHIVTRKNNFDNEPVAIAREHKQHLRRSIERLATKMGLRDPDLAASVAVLVVELTIARTLVTGSLKEAQTARLLFQCLQHA